jgi:SAM-dependent methyltransferase
VSAPDWLAAARLSYDNAAQGYADLVSEGLSEQPDARGVLAWFVEALRGVPGCVVDAGCGPGHVTDYLARTGLDVYGADISPRMIEIARQTYPSLRFEVESFTAMSCADEALAGVLSFYSIVHVPDEAMTEVAREFQRVLRPGGVALIAFHEGDSRRHKSEGYGGHEMDVDVYRRPIPAVCTWMREAGLDIEMTATTSPGTGSSGAVVLARKPSQP